MLKAEDIMSREVITVPKEAPVGEIVDILLKNKISGVPVVNSENKIVGVVTEADLLYRKAATISTNEIYKYGDYLDADDVEEEEVKAAAVTAREVMTTVPICVGEDAELSEIVSIMLEKQIKRVFVVVNERVVGVISKADILKQVLGEYGGSARKSVKKESAGSLMTRDLVTVHKDTPVAEVISILLENRISGVPVVDDAGGVVGVVSETDLVMKEIEHDPQATYWSDREKYVEEYWKSIAATAGEIMTSEIISARPGTPAAELADIMLKNKVKRVLIMDKDQLVGIVSRADVIGTVE